MKIGADSCARGDASLHLTCAVRPWGQNHVERSWVRLGLPLVSIRVSTLTSVLVRVSQTRLWKWSCES